MKKAFLLGVAGILLFSCGEKKPVKVTPPKPSPEEVAYQKKLQELRKQLREDYEKFLTEAYRIQEGN